MPEKSVCRVLVTGQKGASSQSGGGGHQSIADGSQSARGWTWVERGRHMTGVRREERSSGCAQSVGRALETGRAGAAVIRARLENSRASPAVSLAGLHVNRVEAGTSASRRLETGHAGGGTQSSLQIVNSRLRNSQLPKEWVRH
jgi:hypothetical protein